VPRTTHGASALNLKLYRAFNSMKARCYSPRSDMYSSYGGRGIVVCDEWKDNPRGFVEWSLANGYAEGLSIDRIDVNGNYSPDNCRWATSKQQFRNMRKNRWLTFRGRTMILADWAREVGIHPAAIQVRLDRCGWSVERALTEPYKYRRQCT